MRRLHGPQKNTNLDPFATPTQMALEMVSMLAENDHEKWKEIEDISIEALEKRILLWDAINEQIENKTWTDLRSSEQETYSHDYKNLNPNFKF